MSNFTGGFPFELLPTENITLNCWEKYWLLGGEYDFVQKTTKVVDARPKILIDLDEALNYGEQQGSLIVVHKTIAEVTDLPSECSFDNFLQQGYRVVWEITYPEWGFNEIVFFYNFFLLYPGKYFLYIQMEDKYFLCAEPKEHSGNGFRVFFPVDHSNGSLRSSIINYGYNDLARFNGVGLVNCPIPVENILGIYLTTLNNLPLQLPNNYFDTVSNEYFLYVDTSYMRWSIDDEEESDYLPDPFPKDFLRYGLKSVLIVFSGFASPVFKKDKTVRNEEVFLHFRDWDGVEKVVSVLKFAKPAFVADEKTSDTTFLCGEKPEGGQNLT